MKRRTVFKNLAMASAAAWLLPSCLSDPKKVSIALNRLEVTADEESLLGDIADVLLPPATSTGDPGARTVGAHLFALVMVDDCLPKDEQVKYLKGMRDFDSSVRSLTGRSFVEASSVERPGILTEFEARLSDSSDEVNMFYSKTRGYIIQGYTSSQYFLTEVKPYELVPGPNYDGCASISGQSKNIS